MKVGGFGLVPMTKLPSSKVKLSQPAEKAENSSINILFRYPYFFIFLLPSILPYFKIPYYLHLENSSINCLSESLIIFT